MEYGLAIKEKFADNHPTLQPAAPYKIKRAAEAALFCYIQALWIILPGLLF